MVKFRIANHNSLIVAYLNKEYDKRKSRPSFVYTIKCIPDDNNGGKASATPGNNPSSLSSSSESGFFGTTGSESSGPSSPSPGDMDVLKLGSSTSGSVGIMTSASGVTQSSSITPDMSSKRIISDSSDDCPSSSGSSSSSPIPIDSSPAHHMFISQSLGSSKMMMHRNTLKDLGPQTVVVGSSPSHLHHLTQRKYDSNSFGPEDDDYQLNFVPEWSLVVYSRYFRDMIDEKIKGMMNHQGNNHHTTHNDGYDDVNATTGDTTESEDEEKSKKKMIPVGGNEVCCSCCKRCHENKMISSSDAQNDSSSHVNNHDEDDGCCLNENIPKDFRKANSRDRSKSSERSSPYPDPIVLNVPESKVSLPILKIIVDLMSRGSVDVSQNRMNQVKDGLKFLQVYSYSVDESTKADIIIKKCITVSPKSLSSSSLTTNSSSASSDVKSSGGNNHGSGGSSSTSRVRPSKVLRSKSTSQMIPIRETIEYND